MNFKGSAGQPVRYFWELHRHRNGTDAVLSTVGGSPVALSFASSAFVAWPMGRVFAAAGMVRDVDNFL